jgi:hypothetical protein
MNEKICVSITKKMTVTRAGRVLFATLDFIDGNYYVSLLNRASSLVGGKQNILD